MEGNQQNRLIWFLGCFYFHLLCWLLLMIALSLRSIIFYVRGSFVRSFVFFLFFLSSHSSLLSALQFILSSVLYTHIFACLFEIYAISILSFFFIFILLLLLLLVPDCFRCKWNNSLVQDDYNSRATKSI